MSKTYTDYLNKTAITVSESFIDVKTGNNISVSPKVEEQIKYHATNQTLIHLLLSALHNYLHPKAAASSNEIILAEIAELKRLVKGGTITVNTKEKEEYPLKEQSGKADLDFNEVVNILEAFGG